MKINYEDIITSANERKEKLQALAAKLQALPEHSAKLTEALHYFEEVHSLFKALDPESMALLGEVRANRISSVTGKIAALKYAVGYLGYSNLNQLVECVEAA